MCVNIIFHSTTTRLLTPIPFFVTTIPLCGIHYPVGERPNRIVVSIYRHRAIIPCFLKTCQNPNPRNVFILCVCPVYLGTYRKKNTPDPSSKTTVVSLIFSIWSFLPEDTPETFSIEKYNNYLGLYKVCSIRVVVYVCTYVFYKSFYARTGVCKMHFESFAFGWILLSPSIKYIIRSFTIFTIGFHRLWKDFHMYIYFYTCRVLTAIGSMLLSFDFSVYLTNNLL